MQYKCENCRRQIDFDGYIEFCPYCGKAFDGSASGPVTNDSSMDLAQAIDSIWGDNARVKNEFSNVISRCIFLINDYAVNSVEMILPKQDLSNYWDSYSIIKQSNNRKTVISRVDSFLKSLETVIDNLSDRIFADFSRRLEKVAQDTSNMINELYGFLELSYNPSNVDFFSEDNYSVEVLYSKDQLRNLYSLVLVAYVKYKKCVEDNNMFAAFASTSNYGMLPDYWSIWLSNLSKNDDDYEDEKKEDPQFDQVIEYMKTHNAEKYLGMLDEDFVPHVDAFWYGLEMLCDFIDHHIAVEYNICFFINDEERSNLLRVISSKDFDANEVRLDSALGLKERLEEIVEELSDNTE